MLIANDKMIVIVQDCVCMMSFVDFDM